MLRALAAVSPGTGLREALNRVIQAGKGALIVVGDGPNVLNICSGGFLLDAAFSPQRLHELAKMDGALILAADASRIARANVHLVPNPNIPTSETGTRHRTAERVARSIDVPVIAVSEAMQSISVYRGDEKHVLEEIPTLLHRANQAIQTLERYRSRLNEVTSALTALEVEDLVTVRDVAIALQRAERVDRLADALKAPIIELGVDGQQIELQLEELLVGVDEHRRLVALDYAGTRGNDPEQILSDIGELDEAELLDLTSVAAALTGHSEGALDDPIQPAGYRLLSRVRAVREDVAEEIVSRFGSLQKLLRATTHDLLAVPGVSETQAWNIKDGLSRLAQSSILESYE